MKEHLQVLTLIWVVCLGAWILFGFFLNKCDRPAAITYLVIGLFLAVLGVFGIKDLRQNKSGFVDQKSEGQDKAIPNHDDVSNKDIGDLYYYEHWTITQIAKHFNMSRETVRRKMDSWGLKRFKGGRRK